MSEMGILLGKDVGLFFYLHSSTSWCQLSFFSSEFFLKK